MGATLAIVGGGLSGVSVFTEIIERCKAEAVPLSTVYLIPDCRSGVFTHDAEADDGLSLEQHALFSRFGNGVSWAELNLFFRKSYIEYLAAVYRYSLLEASKAGIQVHCLKASAENLITTGNRYLIFLNDKTTTIADLLILASPVDEESIFSERDEAYPLEELVGLPSVRLRGERASQIRVASRVLESGFRGAICLEGEPFRIGPAVVNTPLDSRFFKGLFDYPTMSDVLQAKASSSAPMETLLDNRIEERCQENLQRLFHSISKGGVINRLRRVLSGRSQGLHDWLTPLLAIFLRCAELGFSTDVERLSLRYRNLLAVLAHPLSYRQASLMLEAIAAGQIVRPGQLDSRDGLLIELNVSERNSAKRLITDCSPFLDSLFDKGLIVPYEGGVAVEAASYSPVGCFGGVERNLLVCGGLFQPVLPELTSPYGTVMVAGRVADRAVSRARQLSATAVPSKPSSRSQVKLSA